ncbi:TolC family protein [Sanyastnella coralliicola]|uniref:TolC family protein n=1 Tax=Sanyastnella coralliicola TaxID=3069118 RepID=UPI0027B9E39C|nr:TolC family protein [Longitalea sp. SCSIO 12813]
MSTFKKYIVSVLLVCVSGFLNAQTLDDYLKEASENNPGLKAKYAEFEAAMQRVAQVNALPDPKLSFGYFISPVETRVGPQQAKFGLSQMFPWFGTLAAKGEMATLMAEAKYQVFLNARNELYYKVKAAWYPLYEVNRTLLLQEENRDILYTFKQLATTGFKNDKGSMVDVIRVDIMIENTETDIKLLQDKKISLLTRFNTLLNRADTIQVSVPDSIPLLQVENGYRKDSLLTQHPMLEALNLKMQSVQTKEEVAKKMGLPSFGVGLDYVIVGEGQMNVPDNGKDVVMPMVTMSLPIFRGKYKAAVKEAQFTQSAIALSKEDFENNLVSSYEMAWFELDKALELIELYRAQSNKTEQAIELLLTAYSNSGKDFEEILRMQQELLKYQIADAIALKDYYTALAKLDYLTAKSE